MANTWADKRYWGSDSKQEAADKKVDIIWEWTESDYEWEHVALVHKKGDDGRHLFAVYLDSGCSCNGPYEDSAEVAALAWSPYYLREIGNAVQAVRELRGLGEDEKVIEIASLRSAARKYV